MQKKVDAARADLKTATIQVKALVVDKRKLTMSVFRQIPEMDIINDDLCLNGTPWGLVNYWWDKASRKQLCAHRVSYEDPSVVQVLWQYGDELKRAIVWDVDRLQLFQDRHNIGKPTSGWPRLCKITSDYTAASNKYHNQYGEQLRGWERHQFVVFQGKRTTVAPDILQAVTGKNELYQYWSDKVDDEIKAYNLLVKQLQQLEQLFIAT